MGGFPFRVKRPGREVDHSPPLIAQIQILPYYFFMLWYAGGLAFIHCLAFLASSDWSTPDSSIKHVLYQILLS